MLCGFRFELTSQEFDLLIGIVEKTVLCVLGQLITLDTVFLRSGGSCTAFEGTLVLFVFDFLNLGKRSP